MPKTNMLNAIMNAVMLISMDDDLELNKLIQYITIELLLLDDLKIDFADDVTTKKGNLIRKRLVPDNRVDKQNIRDQNTTKSKMHDLEERELNYEERRLNSLNELLKTIKEHNRIQKETNNILKSFIEICEIAPFVDEKTEICISIAD